MKSLLVVFFLAVPLMAQQSVTQTSSGANSPNIASPVAAATGTAAPVPSTAPGPRPEGVDIPAAPLVVVDFNKVEDLQMQILKLRSENLDREKKQLENDAAEFNARFTSLRAEVLVNHPGCELRGDKIVKLEPKPEAKPEQPTKTDSKPEKK